MITNHISSHFEATSYI